MKKEEGAKIDESTVTDRQWHIHADTGVITPTDATLKRVLTSDPIEKWYALDSEAIASGRFAVVYHCRHLVTGEEFAAKFLSRQRLGVDCTADILHEAAVCSILRSCPSIVQLHDVFSTESHLILVFEYAPGGDLQTLLELNIVPYEHDVVGFMRQLLEGLCYIHDRNVAHLDIKPQNLVLMGDYPDCTVKLCDFDIARVITPGYEVREILGTPEYVAPEVLHYEPITLKTDMWSIGVLTYVLLTGFVPFSGDSNQELYMEISKGEVDFPTEFFEDISKEAIEFINGLLVKNPEQRMTASECLQHPWMQKSFSKSSPPDTFSLPGPETQTTTATSVESQLSTITTDVSVACVTGLPPLPSKLTKVNSDSTPSTPIISAPHANPLILLKQELRSSSRHNLDRIRSMSKSREVLLEKVQMSNLRKMLSKSRERLWDGGTQLSKSRDKLNLKGISQSVEVLSALSMLQQDTLHKSCNNIFAPLQPSAAASNDSSVRMSVSLASINRLDSINNQLSTHRDSDLSLNSDFSDAQTPQHTNFTCYFRDGIPLHAVGLRRNSCKGGRSAETCETKCLKGKVTIQPPQKANKTNRLERQKKDPQKRKKEQERKQKLQSTGSSKEENKSSPKWSPTLRRNSSSQVHQQLQEKQDKTHERSEKHEKEQSKTVRRKNLADNSSQKKKTGHTKGTALQTFRNRQLSMTPRRKCKSSDSSDVSQASSLESMDAAIKDCVKSEHMGRRRKSCAIEPPPHLCTKKEQIKNETTTSNSWPKSSKEEKDMCFTSEEDNNFDEAYNSQDEHMLDQDSSSEIGNHYNENCELENCGLPAELDDSIQSLSVRLNKLEKNIQEVFKLSAFDTKNLKNGPHKDLKIIEEESFFRRSVSTTSDVGSTGSDVSSDECCLSQSPANENIFLTDWKKQSRSHSVATFMPLSSPERLQSMSMQVESKSFIKARPWGNVCSGSVARALEKINLRQCNNVSAAGREKQRRQSSPAGQLSIPETVEAVH